MPQREENAENVTALSTSLHSFILNGSAGLVRKFCTLYEAVKIHSFQLSLAGYRLELICGNVNT